MKLHTWPWAGSNLTPDDRAEIARAEPREGRCLIGHTRGVFRATITHVVPMTVQQGRGPTPIAAFRDALAKVPA